MQEIPALSRKTVSLRDTVADVFSESGAIGRGVRDYEPREGQRQMAAAVAAVIEDGGVLLAEAGTGTGKTLAYLVPALLSRQRVLVSTGTKNLQEQVFFKDLPALRQILGVPFTATLMKGRSNYLCLHRWNLYREGVEQQGASSRGLIDSSDQVLLPLITTWAAETETGDRAELRELPEDLSLWKELSADASSCLGTKCPQFAECFVTRMRQQAAESDVVIVNHHLLCADAAVRHGDYGEVIPSCATLVVDEAHQLEDVATQYFGLAVSHFRVEELIRDAGRLLAARPLGDSTQQVLRVLARASDDSRTFFETIASQVFERGGTGADPRLRYTPESMADHIESAARLGGLLESIEDTFAAMPGAEPASPAGPVSSVPLPSDDQTHGMAAALARRASEIRNDLRLLTRADDPDLVYYLELRGRAAHLRAAPVDVSRIVRDTLFGRMRTTVLTSATLTVDGSFGYVKGRLGIKDADEIRVDSEFDYRRQALLYLPRRMPPPKSPSFSHAAALEVVEILKRSRGRAFVLFTSYAVLRTVQEVVEMSLPYPVLVQGRAPRSSLLDQFRSTPNAVLLATSSFWQGVDVVGDALSCVIIDKIPFASPGDPVTAARIDSIKMQGGDPFAQYQVPLAILTLRQGLGRLIRHRSDRGVLAILDPRLRTMGYGARFLASLPPAPVTHQIDAVEQFFI